MYDPETSKKVDETLSVKWDSGLKSFFRYNFKVGDLISYRARGSYGDTNLATVVKVTDSRLYVKRFLVRNPVTGENMKRNNYQRRYSYFRCGPPKNAPFFLSPGDNVKKGYQYYKQKKEKVKNDLLLYAQDVLQYRVDQTLDKTGEERFKSKSKSKTKLIEKKVYENEDIVSEYVSAYSSYTPSSSSSTKKSSSKNPYLNDTYSNSYSGSGHNKSDEQEVYDDGIDIESIEFRNVTEEEYQLIAEKLSYNRFLNQFIKQEKINNELKNEINNNNKNNANANGNSGGKKDNKVKTFEISDKRVRRFAMKYIKPEDLEKINSINQKKQQSQHQDGQQQQEEEQNQHEYQDQDGNFHYTYDNNDNEYNNQSVYQEDVYYIEPEPIYNCNPDYYNENDNYHYYNDEDNTDRKVYDDQDDEVEYEYEGEEDEDDDNYSYYSENSSSINDYNYNDYTNNTNNTNSIRNSNSNKASNIFHQNNSNKQDQIFEKLIKDLNANNNQDFNEDFEKLNNTFESGYILQNEFHQRRMDLLRDYFNIDLSKYLI